MQSPEVTILLPNFRTPLITTLCLRLLRKHTERGRIRVVVIDNESNDETVEYLRKLRWIDLVERKRSPVESPALSHARALDLGLTYADTPYVMSLHTDTLVKRPGWLDVLVHPMREDHEIVGVGSWKLESQPFLKRVAKQFAFAGKRLASLAKRENHGRGKETGETLYLRSYCAIYRTKILKKHRLSFSGGDAPAGKYLHERLVGLGYKLKFLSAHVLNQYVCHLNHATMVLNPELGIASSSRSRGLRRINRILKEMNADHILHDNTMDE